MPHQIIEYSANLEARLSIADLIDTLHETAAKIDAFPLGGLRTPQLTRRKLLRRGLQVAGLLAVAPALGYSILSEYFVPDELEGFNAIAQRLAEFDWERGDSSIA